MTLKVGDRVRFTSNYIDARKGDTGTVIAVSGHNNPKFACAKVRLDRDGSTPYPYTHRLEKIEEPKFKVGDRVRLPDWVHTEKTGTVTHVRWGSVEVKPDGKDGWHDEAAPNTKNGAGTFAASALVKIGVPFKPEHGDKVVNLKTGREGTVLMGRVWDRDNISAKPVPVKALVEYEEWHPGTYDLIKKDAPW